MPWVARLPSGRWRVQYRDETGRKVSAGRSFPTESAARTFGLDREADVRRGEHRDPRAGRVTVGEWAEQWYTARVAERRTLAKDRAGLDRHLLPALGDQQLGQLTHLAVQGWVRALEKKGLAPATVRAQHRLLHQLLAAAVLEGRIPANPADKVRLPALPPPGDFHWTREEISATAERLDGQDRVVLELLVGTLRWGELAGLHADRIDLLRRRLTVARSSKRNEA
jgi:site-specific recombinase XerC